MTLAEPQNPWAQQTPATNRESALENLKPKNKIPLDSLRLFFTLTSGEPQFKKRGSNVGCTGTTISSNCLAVSHTPGWRCLRGSLLSTAGPNGPPSDPMWPGRGGLLPHNLYHESITA